MPSWGCAQAEDKPKTKHKEQRKFFIEIFPMADLKKYAYCL
jgi:hypothetical protein